MSNLVSYLFQTNAFKVCPENKPFWYTSGKIGPYFINTHFLYGSEESSVEFLKFIDTEKENKLEIPKKI
ncbi:MAG: orotate phosphoribosyltransferase, partial [Clostridia bacterium]|nr:orotate phosphoribosyltransferase [Clostridia bacterium]